MHPKNLLFAAAALLFAVVAYLAWLWQPERQIERHQRHFIAALAARNWQRAATFLDASYQDRWGHDKEGALRDGRIALAQFFTLEIRALGSTISVESGAGTATERLIFEGTGNEFAALAMRRVNKLNAPFTFVWKKSGPRPWEWSLVQVEQPQLQFSGFDF